LGDPPAYDGDANAEGAATAAADTVASTAGSGADTSTIGIATTLDEDDGTDCKSFIRCDHMFVTLPRRGGGMKLDSESLLSTAVMERSTDC
jgi:hypothetical protein